MLAMQGGLEFTFEYAE